MLVLLHALIPCLAAYILHLFSQTFWYCHPYILQHLMEMFLSHCFFVVDSLANTMLFACVRAPPILLLVVMMKLRRDCLQANS